MKPFLVTESTFDETISSNDVVLVDLWAPWCGPCKMLAPVLDELGENNQQLKIAKVNVDDNIEIAKRFSISVIPALLLFKNGELKNKITGFHTAEEILQFINN